MSVLLDLASEALAQGWASSYGEIGQLVAEAKGAGWRAVPIRRGEPEIASLRSVSAEAAHPLSLSAMVGLGRQPLHTDGAHLRQMPDIVILASEIPSSTPTLLTRPTAPTEAQARGVFRVAGQRGAFYSTAVDANGRWRYDPGCMAPADEYARNAVQDFEQLAVEEHRWVKPSMVLVIANRKALHARGEAVDAATRRVYRAAFVSGMDG